MTIAFEKTFEIFCFFPPNILLVLFKCFSNIFFILFICMINEGMEPKRARLAWFTESNKWLMELHDEQQALVILTENDLCVLNYFDE